MSVGKSLQHLPIGITHDLDFSGANVGELFVLISGHREPFEKTNYTNIVELLEKNSLRLRHELKISPRRQNGGDCLYRHGVQAKRLSGESRETADVQPIQENHAEGGAVFRSV